MAKATIKFTKVKENLYSVKCIDRSGTYNEFLDDLVNEINDVGIDLEEIAAVKIESNLHRGFWCYHLDFRQFNFVIPFFYGFGCINDADDICHGLIFEERASGEVTISAIDVSPKKTRKVLKNILSIASRNGYKKIEGGKNLISKETIHSSKW